ncbi:MAG: hypothetical protein QM731_03035 [Chitinophagaceae bacterium]
MRVAIKYYITRVAVLFVALHTLNVSIDIDHITSHSPWINIESYDDIDSFTEFFIEKIWENDNLISELNTDDHHPQQKQAGKSSTICLYVVEKNVLETKPVVRTFITNQFPSGDIAFLKEDFSLPDYNPPDLFIASCS